MSRKTITAVTTQERFTVDCVTVTDTGLPTVRDIEENNCHSLALARLLRRFADEIEAMPHFNADPETFEIRCDFDDHLSAIVDGYV